MDSQLKGDLKANDKCAIDQIISHAGSGADAVFEIKWKLGDITWLPYYQITHLNVLTKYFDLLGISKISKLTLGKGILPPDDSQIFVGSTSFLLTNPTSSHFKSIKSHCLLFLWSIASRFQQTHCRSNLSPITVDINIFPAMTCNRVNHPNFIHISLTHYEILSPDYELPAMIHVRHLADLLGFDAAIHDRGGLTGLTTVPLGFTKFASAWNTGVRANDPQHISDIFLAAKHQDSVAAAANHPVQLVNFHITPEQCGLVTTPVVDPATSSAQADINLKFASMFVHQRQAQRHGFEDRRERRLRAFTTGPATCTKVLSRYCLVTTNWPTLVVTY